MSERESISAWFRNFAESDLPMGKRLKVTALNLSRRVRGKPCCDRPGDPGC